MEDYERGYGHETRHKWSLMLKYYKHTETIIDSRFLGEEESMGLLPKTIVDDRPMIHRTRLEVLKAYLFLKDDSTVLRDVWF